VRADGDIELDGRRIDNRSALGRARAGIGRTFQGVELFDDMTVLDNIYVAGESTSVAGSLRDTVLVRAGRLPASTWAAIDELGLREVLPRDPAELPTGLRRLAGIARTLAAQPTVLLLDEPASGLDDAETRELGRLIRRLATEWNLAVLLIEHDVQLVADVSDE